MKKENARAHTDGDYIPLSIGKHGPQGKYENAGLIGRVREMQKMTSVSTPCLAMPRHLWAVVLAGGDGIRLRDLTQRITGDSRPKQFCRIFGGTSLLSQTRARLEPLFPKDRHEFVLSRDHETYSREAL